MSRPNILTPKQECRAHCSPGWMGDIGDVHRCEHGAYFMAITDWGDWIRLSRFWFPIRYRRAVKALADGDADAD